MKPVFSSEDSALVDLRRSVLEAADIPCEVVSRRSVLDYSFANGPISLAPVELYVPDEDFDRAVALLAAKSQERT